MTWSTTACDGSRRGSIVTARSNDIGNRRDDATDAADPLTSRQRW
jgi:hypothetical protein